MFNFDFDARDAVGIDILPASVSGAVTGGTQLRLANRGLIFADGSYYPVRVMGDVEIAQTAIDLVGMGGRIGLTASEIALWNGDRFFDDVAAEGLLVGRAVKVRTVTAPNLALSDAGGDLASAATAFTGVVAGMVPEGRIMRLSISDASTRLNVPLQSNTYGGTGGLDGSADLAGRPKPVSFGWRYNVTPVFLGLVDLGDGAKLTYQTHWRQISGHDAVRERGLAMTKVTTAPGSGQWRDWPAQGCFQIGFLPNGPITCDVAGDAVGFYAGTTIQIIQRLLTTLGPLMAPSDFDAPWLGLLETQILGEIGWGIGAESIITADAVQDLVAHCGIWLAGSRAGQIRLALPQLTGVSNMALDAGDIVALKPVALPASLQPTPSIAEVIAAKNWTVMTDLAGSVSAADRSLLASAGQPVRVTSSVIASRQLPSRIMSLGGLFRYSTDAQRRAAALAAWLEGGLRAFEVVTDKYLGQVELGHVATLNYPLYGLDTGWSGVVAGWRESNSKQQLTLTLVG